MSAILFDLDGTLIHTIHLYEEACQAALQRHGMAVTPEQFRELYSRPSGLHTWIEELGGDASLLETVRDVRDELYVDLLRSKTEWLPFAPQVIADLQDRTLGIITGSRKPYLKAIDERLGLYEHFDTIVDQDDMDPYHKPHPHGLLLACTRLGVEPENCTYIGDQPFDVDAANAAGMTSVLIRSHYTPDDAHAKADVTLENLPELAAYLRGAL